MGSPVEPATTLKLRTQLLAPIITTANVTVETVPDEERYRTPARHLQFVVGVGRVLSTAAEARLAVRNDIVAALLQVIGVEPTRGRNTARATVTPIATARRLTREPRFGMGTGGPEPSGSSSAIGR
jgi:hypothetical protein